MALELSPKQSLAIYYLAFTGKEPLQSKLPIDLTPKERKVLVDEELITLIKNPAGRGSCLRLNEPGWRWAGENLGCALSKSQTSSEILQSLAFHLGKFLGSRDLLLSEVVRQSTVEPGREKQSQDFEAASALRSAYLRIAEGQLNRPVRIADLAEAAPNLSPATVVETLLVLQGGKQVFFSRVDDPQSITDRDRRVAVHIDNTDKHLVAFTR
jgi:hypothetical protein